MQDDQAGDGRSHSVAEQAMRIKIPRWHHWSPECGQVLVVEAGDDFKPVKEWVYDKDSQEISFDLPDGVEGDEYGQIAIGYTVLDEDGGSLASCAFPVDSETGRIEDEYILNDLATDQMGWPLDDLETFRNE